VERAERIVRMILAGIATGLHFLFGGWSMALMCLIGLVIFDFFTGMGVAKKKGEINSAKGREGAFVKCLYFVLIATMRLMDRGLGLPGPILQTLATWNLILVEGESIVENLGALGVPIHRSIRGAFERLKDKKHDIPLP
jgi:toxin secretion/phage lysis holin